MKDAAYKSDLRYCIRPMVESDLPQVVQLEGSIFPDPWRRESFAESLAEEHVGSWVVESQGRIIGYMVTLWVADEIHILNLAVNNNYRRQGLATHLLSTLERFAKGHQSKHFWLEVRSSNLPAQAFYAKHGFKHVGRRRHYYRNGEDALIMAKNIGDSL
jgi:ribosomal-protein-alanine N-acetyltransferase